MNDEIKERNQRMRRHWELSYFQPHEPHEAQLLEEAKIIDPDAWKVRMMIHRRYTSLEAAHRLSEHRAAREMAVWQEKADQAPRTIAAKILDWFRPRRLEVAG